MITCFIIAQKACRAIQNVYSQLIYWPITRNELLDEVTLRLPTKFEECMFSGNTARDQKDPTPFIIEWIPDILPQCRIGELRIKFEYGHERNGQIERRTSTGVSSDYPQMQTIQVAPV